MVEAPDKNVCFFDGFTPLHFKEPCLKLIILKKRCFLRLLEYRKTSTIKQKKSISK